MATLIPWDYDDRIVANVKACRSGGVFLTCKWHTALRWHTKNIGGYDRASGRPGMSRSIFFFGAYHPTKGYDRAVTLADGSTAYVAECDCPGRDLLVAPEMRIARIYENGQALPLVKGVTVLVSVKVDL